jgi:CHAT domain-containing protein
VRSGDAPEVGLVRARYICADHSHSRFASGARFKVRMLRVWADGCPLFLLLILGVLQLGCRTPTDTMSLDEARRVVAVRGNRVFVPPPRTVTDIVTLLEPDIAAVVQARNRADASPPRTDDPTTLGRFYFGRGRAARRIGRIAQAITDLRLAARYVRPGVSWMDQSNTIPGLDLGAFDVGSAILRDLADTQRAGGSYRDAIADYENGIRLIPTAQTGFHLALHAGLAELYASVGDLQSSERQLADVIKLGQRVSQSSTGGTSITLRDRALPSASTIPWNPLIPARNSADSHVAAAQAAVLEFRGRFAEAERLWRRSIALLMPVEGVAYMSALLDARIGRLAGCLVRRGRLLEAEVEVRKAIRSTANRPNTVAFDSASLVSILIRILREQGRSGEAEKLARVAIQRYEQGGASAMSSAAVAAPRRELAAVLTAQGQWAEAEREYELLREQLQDDRLYQHLTDTDPQFLMTMIKRGRDVEVISIVRGVLQRLPPDNTVHAELRGLLGMALAAQGDRNQALAELASATRMLLDRPLDVDDEATTRRERDQGFGRIVEAYIDLLAELPTTAADPAGADPVAEGFRLADAARGRVVQRALDASSMRAFAKSPTQAQLLREEQDARKELSALRSLLTNALAGVGNGVALADLRDRIETVRRAHRALNVRISAEFPQYAQLLQSSSTSGEQARAALRPGEALIAFYVGEDKTFVWAVPAVGQVAFAVAPAGKAAIERMVGKLRNALDAQVRTLPDIPVFDVAASHALYKLLLEPVQRGWQEAENLFIVGHGALASLPFAVLTMAPSSLAPENGVLFSRYREVPWLVRRHSLTTLPSVGTLQTLRSVPAGRGSRRPFVGFGDPYFSEEQARGAEAETARRRVAQAEDGDGPYSLTSSFRKLAVSPGGDVAHSDLARLPRLPDTAEEVLGIARAMGADLERDVFLGREANEQKVKTLDLSQYRVIAFATHGLLPGDIDGLTQPALALSAPEVAHIDGDGLLTTDEIFGLRLDADWVVLSACNTASGADAGAEAISGLGRAFFYAGARALLVSNWPVETTSARALTTDLFRRQQNNPRLTRAEALRQTMNTLIDRGAFIDPKTTRAVFSYAHPIFWAPFTLVGDGQGAFAD